MENLILFVNMVLTFTKNGILLYNNRVVATGGEKMKIELGQVQKMLEWLKTKLYLDTIAPKARSRAVKKGQVYHCNFGCGIGSEMQKERPAVIVQNDVANSHSGNTIVVPITHDASTLPCVATITPLKDEAGNVILDGQANTSNMMCVSKARLGDFVGSLSKADMKKIDEAIAKAVGLMGYYADLNNRLEDKLEYISKIKEERNKAQDELADLRKILELSDDIPLTEHISKIKITIDKA